jgi:hypothetical protein
MRGVKGLDTGSRGSASGLGADVGSVISGTPFIVQRKKLKFAPGMRIMGKQDGPLEYRWRVGTVVEYLGTSLYQIKFDDTDQKECVLSQFLELDEEMS